MMVGRILIRLRMDNDIIAATRAYEAWLASQTRIVRADLQRKHELMRQGPFVFLRATFYRWIQQWAALGRSVTEAPRVVAVGDLHVENFGTWRDAEGRLVWGVNDVDEACELPYTQDLVRLATSAALAAREQHFALSERIACDAILDGYSTCSTRGGRPIVLAERRVWLRRLALGQRRDPVRFWENLLRLPLARGEAPHDALRPVLPRDAGDYRVHRRVAGVGSLGRQRFVAITEWEGGLIAREAKAWVQSAAVWAGVTLRGDVAETLLARSIRAVDPCFSIRKPWIIRRLAPDCSRIELADLPKVRDEQKLLRAMGWETANMHGAASRTAILRDLSRRRVRWLLRAAGDMADVTVDDWRRWKRLG